MTKTERFMSKVSVVEGGCWDWVACKDRDGYGKLVVGGVYWRAHRYSYELSAGPIPDGLLVCHHCDNPGCVNPAHIFLGTSADNSLDMAAKGRSSRGERRWNAKLTEADVIEIRKACAGGETQGSIAARYSVTQSAISQIVSGKRWGHTI